MDIYPTLVELEGLARPDHVEGRSLVRLLENPSLKWDYPVLSTYGYKNHSVVSEQYRYIRYSDGSEELYDIVADPNEWTNLAGNPRFGEVIDQLAARLPASDAADLQQNR
jgi:arylsulfatase A-like enzyme